LKEVIEFYQGIYVLVQWDDHRGSW